MRPLPWNIPDWREQWRAEETPQTLHRDQYFAALKTLGLDGKSHEPSLAEIAQRHKELSLRLHPDRHIGKASQPAAEAEFKLVGQAFATLSEQSFGNRFVAIDPFGGAPWYHYTRYPPWSLRRGPPYAPGWFVSTLVFGGVAALYSALLYDAAHPALGEQRVQSLLDREAEIKLRKLMANAEKLAKTNEESQAFRDLVRTSMEDARARKAATADGPDACAHDRIKT